MRCGRSQEPRGAAPLYQGCVSARFLPSPSNRDSIPLHSWALPDKIQLPHLQQHHPAGFQLTKHGKHSSLCLHTHVCAQTQGKASYKLLLVRTPSFKLLLSILLKYKTLLFSPLGTRLHFKLHQSDKEQEAFMFIQHLWQTVLLFGNKIN